MRLFANARFKIHGAQGIDRVSLKTLILQGFLETREPREELGGPELGLKSFFARLMRLHYLRRTSISHVLAGAQPLATLR